MAIASAKPPAIPSGRRYRPAFRFSLRTFLAAITIFCVVFGWRINRARLQRDAVAAIRNAGGYAFYDYQQPAHDAQGRYAELDVAAVPPEPTSLRQLLGIDFFHDVTYVNMSARLTRESDRPETIVPPRNIAPHLARFPRLRFLQVYGEIADDAGMAAVGRLKRLECLYCSRCAISDEGIASLHDLKHLRLVEIHSKGAIGDRSLATLARLPNLEVLYLPGNYTDDGLAVFAGHPKLEKLDLSGPCKLNSIGDAGLNHLAQLPNLQSLELGFTRVTPNGLPELQKLPKLRSLYLDHSTADENSAVVPLFPKCKIYCTTAESPFSRLGSSVTAGAGP